MTRVVDLITHDLRMALADHAAATVPRECCGLLVRLPDGPVVGGLHYLPADNMAAGPAGQDRFELDPAVWLRADELRADPVAVVHSHPGASANPSMADRVGCERSGLPWLIVGWPSLAIVQVDPEGWQAPMEGRSFAHGVLDCYTLVQDWYRREWGIVLPDFEREDGWWERGRGMHLYRDGLAVAGFEVVPTIEPERGDGLLMRVAAEVENHAAVYLGDGMMLHHLYGQPSRRERWDWAWQRRTTAVVRHHTRLAR
jgi:cell wall-associated NlpC family hydrolase